MSEPVVQVPFTVAAPDGTTFSDAFSFTEAEWANFSPAQRAKLKDGTHPLCMQRYNKWYNEVRNAPPPVVLTDAQERRRRRREALSTAQAALNTALANELEIDAP